MSVGETNWRSVSSDTDSLLLWLLFGPVGIFFAVFSVSHDVYTNVCVCVCVCVCACQCMCEMVSVVCRVCVCVCVISNLYAADCTVVAILVSNMYVNYCGRKIKVTQH